MSLVKQPYGLNGQEAKPLRRMIFSGVHTETLLMLLQVAHLKLDVVLKHKRHSTSKNYLMYLSSVISMTVSSWLLRFSPYGSRMKWRSRRKLDSMTGLLSHTFFVEQISPRT